MYIPSDLLPSGLLFAAHPLVLIILILAAWQAPWRRLREGCRQHVFLGAVVALLLLWRLDVGITPGLGFHFLGVTVFTLMFGWSLGVVGATIASLGVALSGGSMLESLSLNTLLLGMLPVSVSYGIYRGVCRYLPRHVFIYIFVCAFLGGVMTAAVTVLCLATVLLGAETYALDRIAYEYLPFLPLYLLPEGLLNGMLTAIFIGMRPEWLSTFDGEFYFKD